MLDLWIAFLFGYLELKKLCFYACYMTHKGQGRPQFFNLDKIYQILVKKLSLRYLLIKILASAYKKSSFHKIF